MQKIGIIGAGAWGTALAQAFVNDDREVLMWAREPEVVKSINEKHENTMFLPGVKLDPRIKATESLSQAAETAGLILLVTPAQHVRSTLTSLKGHLTDGKPVVICAKGIEKETGYLMSQVAEETVPGCTIALLTGPTFASEISKGLPSAVTIAAKDKDVAQQICDAVAGPVLRPYVTEDLIGVQIGGAIKNVIAIASGIISGRGLGESARAALITRGLAEMARLSTAMGGKRETLMGMCGVGDLILTATSMQSRNYSFGVALGKGSSMQDVLDRRNAVTEGVHTAAALTVLAQRNAVDMPVSKAVHRCLNEGAELEDIVREMMDRPLKTEVS